ncbi:MAG: hydroxymethylglutaryl-CoA lyase [Eubacteriaceae bacterium]|jgi:hydroxymethylglutaryl-CoA lyase|nr:hydroxymethylglutaryl-CoA lyase [Eubacteriaceae bacterium]
MTDMCVNDKVDLIEVGPRDGFQNIKKFIPTDIKIDIIKKIIASGVKEIELTSFVHPKAIPQMADAADVVKAVLADAEDDNGFIALIPNKKGAENALKAGIRTVSCVISVSESHNRANVSRTREESKKELKDLIKSYPELNVRLDLATTFGCSIEGAISEDEVMRMAAEGLEMGVCELVLCDTIGIADPKQVCRISRRVLDMAGDIPVALHLHDTRGIGTANVLAGYQAGITRFEASIGGLGGCPFAPGAAGNTAMEDLLNMFDSMGVKTGIDFGDYYEAIEIVKSNIKEDLTGHMGHLSKELCLTGIASEAV